MSGRFIDTSDPDGPIARMREQLEAQRVPFKGDELELEEPRTLTPAIELEEPRTLELDGGQIVLAADVEERGGQLVLEELARPPVPAPLNHIPEHPAAELAELWKEA